MIIKCEDKIINSDAVKIIEIFLPEDEKNFYIVADNEIIGCYETKERAREVLEEICERILIHNGLYYMPKK